MTTACLGSIPQVSSIEMSSHLDIYKRDVVCHSPGIPCGIVEPAPENKKQRGKIAGFSQKSKQNAVFVANNSDGLSSQFLCTYHETPEDGRLIKSHLNTFLSYCRKLFPNFKYFWFLEFQNRGAAHYHVFTNLNPNKKNRLKLANFWLMASDQINDAAAISFHEHRKIFIEWELSGPYVAKYASKMDQKVVPSFFKDVGRFWGASRFIVPIVATASIPAKLSRVIKALLLSRLKRSGKIPYSKFQLFKKLRKYTVSLDDNLLHKLLSFTDSCHYRVGSLGLRNNLANIVFNSFMEEQKNG